KFPPRALDFAPESVLRCPAKSAANTRRSCEAIMRFKFSIAATLAAALICSVYAIRAHGANNAPPRPQAPAQPQANPSADAAKALVARLDLERYKATIKGLTQFGDRREGTERNRKAVDWIEAQLKSYGCQDVQRLKYDYKEPAGAATGIVPSG